MSSATIAIVDDDPEIRDIVREYLSDEGFAVQEAADGSSMHSLLEHQVPDVVLLDLRLPGEDGLSLARHLRKEFPTIGILMITGKEDVTDRVAGLEVGADDYLVKPFHLRELLARVRSVLRRQENHALGSNGANGAADCPDPAQHNDKGRQYAFADWILNESDRTLHSTSAEKVDLTGGEFDLLLAFVSHPQRALTRDQLLDYARSRDAEVFDRSIDVQVGRLRRKIERNAKRPALIKTVRNVGYMFCADVTVKRT